MNRCEKTINLISAYLDNSLDKEALVEFDNHVNECKECKKILDEYKLQIEICNDLEQEDLPLGFREELHSKLIIEKKKISKGGLISLTCNKYMRTFATIAAGLVFLVVLKGIFGNMDFHLDRASYPAEANKAAVPLAPAAEVAKADVPREAAKMDEAPKAETAVEDNLKKNMKSISGSGTKKEASESKVEIKEEAQEVKAKIQANPEVKSFSTTNSFDAMNENSSVSITVSNINESIDRIEGYLSNVGGSIVQDPSISPDLKEQTTVTMDRVSNEIEVLVKVPKSQYEKFESSLKELDASIIYGKPTNQDEASDFAFITISIKKR